MKVDLKNVKVSQFASHETACFQATLYIDGKRAATVDNSGQGGPNFYHFDDRALERAFHAYCEGLPPRPSPFEDFPYSLPMNADMLVGEIMERLEIEKQYRQWCKKATVFRLKDDKPDVWRTIKGPFSPKARDFIVSKYGDRLAEILNETLGQKP